MVKKINNQFIYKKGFSVKNIVLSLVFLFVVSLGVQAQSTSPKKEKAATTTTAATNNKTTKVKAKMDKKSTKKACTDASEKSCCGEAEKGCADSK
ncbi:MAG: hypothetical protein COZ80_02890 [Ignavibacteria bacterium CG_4_8_14_3_um_filter_37_9]|nr:MAG: hypothetical protein AUJ54_00670 [Ignavibacteria bacterium CG1_02_37_35]PIP78628.1 MAG: hypothetical protein COW85_03510 [Ignavibacteria bacterium CG22_combo_CG10-13_8_21_14_all_37_15]PIS46414.1 MAG: hypothetical protein COT22_00045 [Ignavibacteria bacterium CG08_land_8_20_14_0_20_37_9]PIW99902.1 MAG: hypothetical protein COZ80_02890 [Ignavibacteria bacterium CG_4_8_14_3_um_filter_37_9]PIX93495.1 MAG: hypothetical protein COZ25_10225 [Ignavibacteria bacterium CG_4_10_14_3_um_filter_37_1